MKNFKFLAPLAVTFALLTSCGGANNTPIVCPAGQVNVNNTCIASNVGNNAYGNGYGQQYGQSGYGQQGYNGQYNGQYGGQYINGVYQQGQYGQYQNGVNGQCLSLYSSGCPSGYLFSPQYNNCVMVQQQYGYGSAYGYGYGTQIGLQYQYQNTQMVQTPYGMFPSGPCITMCGAGYAYINNACYR